MRSPLHQLGCLAPLNFSIHMKDAINIFGVPRLGFLPPLFFTWFAEQAIVCPSIGENA